MRNVRRTVALLLVMLVTLTACGQKSEPPVTQSVTVEAIRKQAASAFDGTISSAQRRAAADEAMRLLLALLGQPDSTAIPEKEWAESPRPGVGAMVRHIELDGGVHLYALALPGASLVETRERVAVQVRRTGSDPRAVELPLLPDSRLLEARMLRDGSNQMLTLALSLNAGGGYVAHFQMGKEGEFQLAGSAFSGLSGRYGSLTLSVKDGYLMVSSEEAGGWRPAFDPKQPLRLVLAPDLTLDWKQKFVLVDDSRFDAFALFQIALNPARCKGPENCPEALLAKAKTAPKEVAKAAWEQATRKMTALLQDEKSWADDFTGKLPEGSRSMREQGRDLSTRLLTVPAPEGISPPAYTAVQFRSGGGLPTARTLDLPGPVDSYRVMSHEGLPALFLMVDQTKDAKSSVRTRGLHLLRLNAGNDWVPAENWVGSVPNAPHWNLTGASPNGVLVEWESTRGPSMSVSLETGAEPAVAICQFPTRCHRLTWVGGKLHALSILFAQLSEATQALPEDQLVWRVAQVAEFLAGLDPTKVTPGQLTSLLDPNGALKIQVFEAGSGTRLVTMPANPTGLRMALIHTKDQALVVKAYDGFVTRWEGARVYQGGNQQRLLVLGTSEKGAMVMAFQWDGTRWVAVDALDEKVSKILQESATVYHVPGETRPIHGIRIVGSPERLSAQFTAEGVLACENRVACVLYGYSNGWKLQYR